MKVNSFIRRGCSAMEILESLNMDYDRAKIKRVHGEIYKVTLETDEPSDRIVPENYEPRGWGYVGSRRHAY